MDSTVQDAPEIKSDRKGKRFDDPNKLGNTRGHRINGKANKDRRREEAFAREAAAKKLPTAERLKWLEHNIPNGAKRQKARFRAILEKQAAAQAEQLAKKKAERLKVAAGTLVTR